MKHSMRRLLFSAALALAFVGPALATSSLSYNGGGYGIDMEVGADETLLIASVRFHAPGDRTGVRLSPEQWEVEAFDTRRQVLVLRYRGGSQGVAPFTLSVHQQTAVLHIDGRRIESPFGWDQ